MRGEGKKEGSDKFLRKFFLVSQCHVPLLCGDTTTLILLPEMFYSDDLSPLKRRNQHSSTFADFKFMRINLIKFIKRVADKKAIDN